MKSHTNEQLLATAVALVNQKARCDADLIRCMDEIDKQKAYLDKKCESLKEYCIKVLRLSRSGARKRLRIMKLARTFPVLIERLEAPLGERVRLSCLDVLAAHITESNCEQLLAQVAGKTKREVEAFVATLSTYKKKTRPSANRSFEPDLGDLLRVARLEPAGYRVEFRADPELYEDIERVRTMLNFPAGDLAPVFAWTIKTVLGILTNREAANEEVDSKASGRALATEAQPDIGTNEELEVLADTEAYDELAPADIAANDGLETASDTAPNNELVTQTDSSANDELEPRAEPPIGVREDSGDESIQPPVPYKGRQCLGPCGCAIMSDPRADLVGENVSTSARGSPGARGG